MYICTSYPYTRVERNLQKKKKRIYGSVMV